MAENIILWDGPFRERLLPFTFTRPVGLIRTGILSIAEKYAYYFSGSRSSFLTQPYLQKKFPAEIQSRNLLINASVLPDHAFAEHCKALKEGESLWKDDLFLAGHFSGKEIETLDNSELPANSHVAYAATIALVDNIWKIFSLNEGELAKDFKLITQGRKSQPIPQSNFVKNPENIFIEQGAVVESASLNASSGPIYIGKDAEVMEGSLIRGPFSLGEHSTLKLGAKIYGATTIGPHCKVGGEVNNSVFFGYANKAHDGFIGNAVIGEWCNIGADSNNSNLKNNYEEVKIWSYPRQGFERTGLQFCGLFLGDHSKCGINTMFNTGTVVGVSANIFGGGFPRNFIPSFSWGGASGFTTYQLAKALDTAALVLARRGLMLEQADKDIFEYIFQHTQQYRNF